MRRPILFSVVFGATIFLSVNVQVHAESPLSVTGPDLRWNVLSDDEKALIDRIAADFYEATLRPSQSQTIEDGTALAYIQGDKAARTAFIKERRAQWRRLNADERRALRNTKTPNYDNLTDAQKMPFRRHALDKLKAKGAINESALTSALRTEV